MGRLAERTTVRLAFFAILALVLVWPMLAHAAWLNEFRDAQVLSLHERTALDTVRRFGQLPLWDPWYCGGLYGLGAPQGRFASPTFLLSLAGLPVASVPAGLDVRGLPVGLQIVARPRGEEAALALAAVIEAMNPIGLPDPERIAGFAPPVSR